VRSLTTLSLGGDISGSGRLTKASIGTLRLTGNSSYSGGTIVSGAGRIEVGSDTALGTGALSMEAAGAVLALADPAVGVTLANNVTMSGQPLVMEMGNAGTVFGLAGGISGRRDVTMQGGGGTLLLSGNNSGHRGSINVGTGVLAVGSNAAVGSQGQIRLSNGTTLAFAAAGIDIDTAVINAIGAGNVVASIDTGSFNGTVSASLRDAGGTGGETLALEKRGTGILTLSNPNTPAGGGSTLGGGITVLEGTLNLTGALAGDIGMAPGTTLAGTGRQTAGDVTMLSGSTLAPGDATAGPGAVGTLSLNTLFMSAGTTASFDLAAPGASDLVVVNGPLQLGGSLNVNPLAGFGTGTYTLFTYGGALSGSLALGTLPAGYLYSLSAGGGTVNLLVSLTDFYWDGNGPAGDGVVNGGSGTWSTAATNWTNQAGTGIEAFQAGGTAFFTGTGGVITLADSASFGQLNFEGNGYVITPAAAQALSAAGGVISVSAGNTATINSVLAGTGGLAKNGSGTLVLSGANTVTGGININGGTLAVTNAAALGPDAVFINGGLQTLRFDASMTVENTINATGIGYNIDTGANTVILNGSLSGDGADKLGTGTLVLNNAINAQPNTLAVFNGTLIVNGGVQGDVSGGTVSAIGGTGTITGTLATSGTLTPGAAPGQAGTLTVGALGLNSASTSLFDLGALGGVNDLVVSNGALTINGTLNINPLAGWNVGTGRYTLFTYAGALTDNGLDLGTSLTSGAPTGVSYAIDTSVAGQVNLVRSYAGNFNWDGAGPAADGVLQGGTGTWDGSATNWANDPGTFNLAYVDGTTTVANFGGASGGTVSLAGDRTAGTVNFTTAGYRLTGDALTLAGAATISVASAITAVIDSEVTGASGLTKTGGGTLFLAGANSYAGDTALGAGTIAVGSNAALAASTLMMADGTTLAAGADNLVIANAITTAGVGTIDTGTSIFALAGGISGTGTIAKAGTGTLVLNTANSYAGGTALGAGTIAVGNDGALGSGALAMAGGTRLAAGAAGLSLANAISTAGVGTIDTGASTLTLTGVISGPGSIAKAGTGTLVLAGANTYAGGTALGAGGITVGSNTALGTGALTAANATTLANGGTALSLANAIALTGPGFTVDSGAATASFTLAGAISGAGGLAKTGAGLLTLSGASSYTGATTVTAGTLNVTGSLASAVTVQSGAAITGTGSMAALTVAAGATVNPGVPGTTNVGTLTVGGPASLLGTHVVDIAGATTDRVTAAGALTVGGTLTIGSFTGIPLFNQPYVIASGASRTGTFGTVNGLSLFGPAFNAAVEYTGTAVNIRLTAGSLVAAANLVGGATGNALEAGAAFDRAVLLGYNPQAFAALYTSGNALPRALLEISGEQRATERRVVLETSRVFRETALDRLNLGLASLAGQQVRRGDVDTGAVTFWLRGAGAWGTADTSGAATGFTTEQRGLLTGIDWALDGLTVGAMFHYTSTDIDYRVLGGSSNVETTGGTFYAGYRQPDAGLVANAGLSVVGARTTGARAITLPGLVQTLQGRTTGTSYQVFGELAWDIAGSAGARVEPFARLTYAQADMNGLVETNGIAALRAPRRTYDLAVANLGLRVGTNLADKVNLNASAAWQRTSGAREATTIIGIPAVGQNAAIRSVALDPDAALLQADIGVHLSDRARLNVGYSGLIGKNNSDHAGRATLSFAF
jgi:autotransporter-associated beta strand protein